MFKCQKWYSCPGQQLIALIWCVTLYCSKQGLGKPQDYNVSLSLSRFFQELLLKTNCRCFSALSKLLRPFQMRNPNFLFLSGSFVSYVGAKITHTKPLFTTQTNWNTCCEVTLQQNLSFSATPCNFRIATLSTEKRDIGRASIHITATQYYFQRMRSGALNFC